MDNISNIPLQIKYYFLLKSCTEKFSVYIFKIAQYNINLLKTVCFPIFKIIFIRDNNLSKLISHALK